MRRSMFALFVGLAALVATSGVAAQRGGGQPPDPAAVRVANNRFAGTWKLVNQETRDAKDQVVPSDPDANSRFGFIVYDAAGYMSVTMHYPNRQKFAGRQPTPDEARAALGAYQSYWGSFAVNGAATAVTHQTFGAISPAM